jgi:hypothetical protein
VVENKKQILLNEKKISHNSPYGIFSFAVISFSAENKLSQIATVGRKRRKTANNMSKETKIKLKFSLPLFL